MDSFSDSLYATPSFFEGAARIMDIADSMSVYNDSASPAEADRVSAAMDRAAEGHYIRSSADAEMENDGETDRLPSCL